MALALTRGVYPMDAVKSAAIREVARSTRWTSDEEAAMAVGEQAQVASDRRPFVCLSPEHIIMSIPTASTSHAFNSARIPNILKSGSLSG